MINPDKLKNIATESFKDGPYLRDQIKLSEDAVNQINAEIICRAEHGEFEVEINLNKLYELILDYNNIADSNFSFSRHNFNMFIARIRNELNKYNYKFEEKKYQYDAYPDPILIIRW